MKSHHINGLIIKWFEDYLFNRVEMCEIDSQRLLPCPIKCGVPQGSILGPILLLLYLNDFKNCLKCSNVVNFADETVVFLLGKTHLEIERGLNFDF